MKHPLFCIGLAALSSCALATTVNLATPGPTAYADTESAVTHPLSGWDNLTRFFTLSMEVETNANICVQVAFGCDANADGNLAPEETALVCGYDCGAWYARDERNGATPIASATFDLKPYFDPSWNAAKVTTRGSAAVSAVLVTEFKNNPMRIILR